MSLSATLRVLAWLYVLLVAYLHLAQLSLQSRGTPFVDFLLGPTVELRDIVENFLLGLPLGLVCGLGAILSRRQLRTAALAVAGKIVVVILPIEFLQSWMPDRNAALHDVVMILLGALSATIVLFAMRGPIVRTATTLDEGTGGARYLLILVWLLSFWIPARLQLDSNVIRDGLMPIVGFTVDRQDLGEMFSVIAGWAVAFALSQRAEAGWLPGSLIFLSWVGLVLAPDRELSWGVVAGSIAAFGLRQLAKEQDRMTAFAATAALAALLVQMLTAPAVAPGQTYWIPLTEGQRLSTLELLTGALSQNFALLGLPLLLALPSGGARMGWTGAFYAVVVAVVTLEALSWAVGQTVTTTPLLFLALGLPFVGLHLLGQRPATGNHPATAGTSGR